MIINGVKAGRRLHGGKFDMGDVWDRRSYVLSDSDSIAARVFEPEREANFILLIAYQPDSVNQNQLLFELARFNFTNFLVRNFDLNFEDLDGIRRLRLEGFRSYDEVLQYARALYQQENIIALLEKARIIIISDKNLELLGTQFSYEDYDKFYEQHFVPLKISTVRLLTEPASIEYEREPETPAPEQPSNGSNELYNGGVLNNETLIDLGIEQPEDNSTFDLPTEEPVTIPQQEPQNTEIQQPEPKDNPQREEPQKPTLPTTESQQPENQKSDTPKTEPITTPKTESTVPVQKPQPVNDGTIEIPAEIPATKPQTPVIEGGTIEIPTEPTPKSQAPAIESGTIEIPTETAPKPQAPTIESGTIEIPAATPAVTAPAKPAATQKPVTKPKEQPATKPKQQPVTQPKKQPAVEDTGIDFGDGFGGQNRPTTNKKEEPKKKKPVIDLEDEYYDLDGF